LKSPAATPLARVTASGAPSAAKPPPAWRSSAVTVPAVLLVAAMSGRPSALKSATANPSAPAPMGIGASAVKPSLVAFRSRTLTVLVPRTATAMSGRPSPLKSAALMPSGEAPTGIAAASDTKPSLVALRSNTVTEPAPRFEMARSGRPSPLKSAAATSRGVVPVGLVPSVAKPAPLLMKVTMFELE
jgi:hypothetical protein